MNWTKVSCHGEIPEGRTKHSSVIVEDRLLLVGGGMDGYIPFGGGNGYNLIMSCSSFYAFNLCNLNPIIIIANFSRYS